MKELFYAMSEGVLDTVFVASVFSLVGLCLSFVFRLVGWLVGFVENWQ